MQPKPMAETSSPLLPNVRLCMCGTTPRRFSPRLILVVADLFHPVHRLAIQLLLNGDVCHGRRWSRAVPVLLARRKPDHVARPNRLDRAAPSLRQAAAGGDDECLAERVRVPRRTGSGFERDTRADGARRIGGVEQRIDPDGTGKPIGRPFAGRLRAASLNLHVAPSLTPALWAAVQ